jgi:hypothetical protein
LLKIKVSKHLLNPKNMSQAARSFPFQLEIIMNSQVVAKKCTGKSYIPFTQPSLMLTSYTTILQYKNVLSDIGITHRAY